MRTRLYEIGSAAFNHSLRFVLRGAAKLEIEGREHVPAEGPVVLVANHLNSLDPPLVCLSTPRVRVRSMAKRELFETPLVGWTLWVYGAFPVRRFSADIGALRTGRNLLRNGHAVLVFPEGHRSPHHALQPALPGAAMMALLGGAPIVPVAITGTETLGGPGAFLRFLRGRRSTVRIRFGEPFNLPEGRANTEGAERATDLMMRHVAALLPESYRGAYGAASEGEIVVSRSPSAEAADTG